jgi:hypothetical protein
LPRGVWPAAFRALAGFLIGLAVWWGAGDLYPRIIAPLAQPVLRATEQPPVTRLRPSEREVIVDRADFPARSARPGIPLHDLTFNVILLFALFATNRPLFSNRNVAMFGVALLALFATHVLALVVEVKSIYAMKLGAWSAAHYGSLSRNLWAGGAHFYRLVGMFGIAFLLWWLLRPGAEVARPAKRRVRRRKRKT